MGLSDACLRLYPGGRKGYRGLEFLHGAAIAIWAEESVVKIAYALETLEGTRFGRVLGFVWTASFMSSSFMAWTNETAACGFWVAQPMGSLAHKHFLNELCMDRHKRKTYGLYLQVGREAGSEASIGLMNSTQFSRLSHLSLAWPASPIRPCRLCGTDKSNQGRPRHLVCQYPESSLLC